MYTLIAGVTCKIVMNYILVGIPGINIHGGPYASIICYTVSMVPNLYFVCRYAHLKFNFPDWVIKPGLSALLMGIVVWLLKTFLPTNRLFTLIEVMAGIAVYILVSYKLGVVSQREISFLKSFLRRKGNHKK